MMETQIQQLKLNRLTINHFKGLKHFVLEPNGQSMNIFGDNATYKTTLADAIMWLWVDKDTQGKSPDAFGIKTRENGEVMHGVEHEVIGEFTGITLRKVYREILSREDYSSKGSVKGHTTDYYINGAPCGTKREYDKRIEEIIGSELFRWLTDPADFAEKTKWERRREVLMMVGGDVPDEEIIQQHPKLKDYSIILAGESHKNRKKELKDRKTKLIKQLGDDNNAGEIQLKINENQRLKTDVSEFGVSVAQQTIGILTSKKENLQGQLADIRNGGGVSELRIKIQEIEAQKAQLKTDHQAKQDQELTDLRSKVQELQSKVDEANQVGYDKKREYSGFANELTTKKDALRLVTDKIASIKNRQPEPDKGEQECPYCHRPMEQEHSYDEYLEEFNAHKADDLKSAMAEAQVLEGVIDSLSEDLKIHEQQVAKASGSLSQRKEALDRTKGQLMEQKMGQTPVEDTPAFHELTEQQTALQSKIDNWQTERDGKIAEVNASISDVDQKIAEQQKVIASVEQNERIDKRIAELKGELHTYASQLEEVEYKLHIMEEFVRARASYVTDRVNAKFRLVTWRLFKDQINGGLQEVCEAVYDGIPYSEGLNNASRIKAGLDIIQTLSDFYGKSAPILLDNAESIVEIPDTGLQVISLYVSGNDKALRIEPVTEYAKNGVA